MAAPSLAPTPDPAASLPAGGDAAGSGLVLVRTPPRKRAKQTQKGDTLGDGWVLVAPVAGSTAGYLINQGHAALLLFVAAGVLVLIVLADLVTAQLARFEKRRQALAEG